MSKVALEAMAEFDEVNLFLRGIIPQLGFQTSVVEYERKERTAGESKYPMGKMVALATEGITSFSIKPLKLSMFFGSIAAAVSVIMILYCLVQNFRGNTVSGWTSLSVSIWALGALQLIMLGIVGEYIGKIYLESKHRPRYIIEKILLDENKTEK